MPVLVPRILMAWPRPQSRGALIRPEAGAYSWQPRLI